MNDIFDDGAMSNHEPGEVRTRSIVRMLWLTTAKGYDVAHTVQTPVQRTVGGIAYKKTYVLRPRM